MQVSIQKSAKLVYDLRAYHDGTLPLVRQEFHQPTIEILRCSLWLISVWSHSNLSAPYWRLYWNQDVGAVARLGAIEESLDQHITTEKHVSSETPVASAGDPISPKLIREHAGGRRVLSRTYLQPRQPHRCPDHCLDPRQQIPSLPLDCPVFGSCRYLPAGRPSAPTIWRTFSRCMPM